MWPVVPALLRWFFLRYDRLADNTLFAAVSSAIKELFADPKHFDKNFARMFVFWDRLAGTLYLPKEREEITFGMGGEEREFDSLWKIYTLPFKKVAAKYLTKQTA